jgi:hypothetical protein
MAAPSALCEAGPLGRGPLNSLFWFSTMERFSHCRLKISSAAAEKAEIEAISAALGCQPSEVAESPVTILKTDGSGHREDRVYYFWVLNSPLSAKQASPADRLLSLIEVIRPFSERLTSLDAHWGRGIDMVESFSIRPAPYPAFDWFRLPASAIKTLGEWNVDFSYETFWFSEPDQSPVHRRWWERLCRTKTDRALE